LRPTRVYKAAALLPWEDARASDPIPPIAPGQSYLFTRCRWPQLGLTYICFNKTGFPLSTSKFRDLGDFLLNYKALAAL
jgi:hypothetical protein